MGINLEYVTFLSYLQKQKNVILGKNCYEFGAQDISADPVLLAEHLLKCGINHNYSEIKSAKKLYSIFGFIDYVCIDATGEKDALVFDLNKNLGEFFDFNESFDLVTDLGTFEHVFDIASAFKNAHELCSVNGLMIHVLPSNCNTNHGYYAIQPRMIADISIANDYEIVEFAFTVDYKPYLFSYNVGTYKIYDDRDLMFYVALQKKSEQPFKYPFDSIFSQKNKLSGYYSQNLSESFSSYIKSSWNNVKPDNKKNIPITILSKERNNRKFIKKIIDYLGKYF